MEPPSSTSRWVFRWRAGPRRHDLGHLVKFGDAGWDQIVVAPVVVLGPGVELPVGVGAFAGDVGFLDEDGAGVAKPDAVGGPLMEVDPREIGASALEDAGGAAFGSQIVDQNVHVFDTREEADDLRIDPGDRLEFSGASPRRLWGPGDPRSGGVRSPLGGHAVCGDSHRVRRYLLWQRFWLQGYRVRR